MARMHKCPGCGETALVGSHQCAPDTPPSEPREWYVVGSPTLGECTFRPGEGKDAKDTFVAELAHHGERAYCEVLVERSAYDAVCAELELAKAAARPLVNERCADLAAENERLKADNAKFKVAHEHLSTIDFRHIGDVMVENKALRQRVSELEERSYTCYTCGDGLKPLKKVMEIENLRTENEALEAKLARAMKALEFYADRENWEHSTAFAENTVICGDDHYCHKGDYFYGGKTARQAIEELEE